MLEVYWICLISGAIITLITLVFGEVIDGFFDGILDFLSIEGMGFLQPITLVGGLTMFGGIGIMLTEYTSLNVLSAIMISLLVSLILSILLYFFYIKPMKNLENSTGFSIMDHVGKLAEVITSIPSNGHGEVMIKAGIGVTNEIAASFDGDEIEAGSRVVVVEVKDHTLYVVRFENMNE